MIFHSLEDLPCLGSRSGVGRIEGRVHTGAGKAEFPLQVTSAAPLVGAGQ